MNRYFEETILNADPMDLIRLLYQKAISSVEDAREHLRERRIAQRTAAINGAYAVLAELMVSLRPEAAPELSKQLGRLYSYIQQRLLDANLQQAEEPLTEVISLLTTLEEGWGAAAQALSPGQQPKQHAWASAAAGCADGERLAVHA
jgi:flagellar secretion chaperone FliS